MQKKLTIEDVLHISIRQFKGSDPGDVYSISGGTVKAHISDGCMILVYAGHDFEQCVPIEYTNVGYGKRAWFCCPTCYERTSRLYRNGLFKCRKCSDLTYLSSQISGNRLNELARQIRIRQRRLGMNTAASIFSPDYVGIDDTPLFKPKYMKQTTFDILKQELEIVQLHRIEEWLKIAR